MNAQEFLDDSLLELGKLKGLADRALAQIPDEALFARLDDHSNPLAIVIKHMAGNMRSRWTDFLTTDGEKPDRHRDNEFVLTDADTADALRGVWEAGWKTTLDSIGSLAPADVDRTVAIRGEPHTVPQAIRRQTSHYAYHVGQIVLLARHLAGEDWQYLSIPPGKSEEFDVTRHGHRYIVDPPR